jgi:hypothetical protein
MKKFITCRCGCGRIITNPYHPNQRYILEHKPERYGRKLIKEKLTYDVFVNHRDLILKTFEERLIKCSIKSPNITLKDKCLTTKPRRGNNRTHRDKYTSFTITIGNVQYITRAHIIAGMLAHGDPGNLHSLHRCDVKMCCNPNHIYFGTQRENLEDYCNRRKELHPNRNLTRLQVNSILYYLERGEHTNAEIAKGVGCHTSTIGHYKVGRFVLTTDGTEVMGKDWFPIEIPEPGENLKQKYKQKVLEVLEIAKGIEKMKSQYPPLSYLEIYKGMGINRTNGLRYRKLLKINLEDSDYYLSIKKLFIKYGLMKLYGVKDI